MQQLSESVQPRLCLPPPHPHLRPTHPPPRPLPHQTPVPALSPPRIGKSTARALGTQPPLACQVYAPAASPSRPPFPTPPANYNPWRLLLRAILRPSRPARLSFAFVVVGWREGKARWVRRRGRHQSDVARINCMRLMPLSPLTSCMMARTLESCSAMYTPGHHLKHSRRLRLDDADCVSGWSQRITFGGNPFNCSVRYIFI